MYARLYVSYILTHKRKYTQMSANTQKRTKLYLNLHACTHVHARTHTRVRIQMHKSVCSYTRNHAHTHMYVNSYVYVSF